MQAESKRLSPHEEIYGDQAVFQTKMAALVLRTLSNLATHNMSDSQSVDAFLACLHKIAEGRAAIQATMQGEAFCMDEAELDLGCRAPRRTRKGFPSSLFSSKRYHDATPYFTYFSALDRLTKLDPKSNHRAIRSRNFDDWNNDTRPGSGLRYLRGLLNEARIELELAGHIRSNMTPADYTAEEQAHTGNWLARRFASDRMFRRHLEALDHVVHNVDSSTLGEVRKPARGTLTVCGPGSIYHGFYYLMTARQGINIHHLEEALSVPGHWLRESGFAYEARDSTLKSRSSGFLSTTHEAMQRQLVPRNISEQVDALYSIQVLPNAAPGEPKELGLMIPTGWTAAKPTGETSEEKAATARKACHTLWHFNPFWVRGILLHTYDDWLALMQAKGTLNATQLQHHLSRFVFRCGLAMPYVRGSASIVEIMALALAARHGYFLDLGAHRHEMTMDWLNFLVTCAEEYEARFPAYFPIQQQEHDFFPAQFMPGFTPAGTAITTIEAATAALARSDHLVPADLPTIPEPPPARSTAARCWDTVRQCLSGCRKAMRHMRCGQPTAPLASPAISGDAPTKAEGIVATAGAAAGAGSAAAEKDGGMPPAPKPTL